MVNKLSSSEVCPICGQSDCSCWYMPEKPRTPGFWERISKSWKKHLLKLRANTKKVLEKVAGKKTKPCEICGYDNPLEATWCEACGVSFVKNSESNSWKYYVLREGESAVIARKKRNNNLLK